ncbi:MAG: glycine oxidase ThiO [Acidobacteriaceae bacterium]
MHDRHFLTIESVKRFDAVIIGAGIIGLSLALELHQRGISVAVLERGEPGREASWAAAGMLNADDPHTPTELRELAMWSAALYPEFIARVEDVSGEHAGYSRIQALFLSDVEIASWSDRALTPTRIAELEPALSGFSRSVYLLDEAAVDPRILLKAMLAACKHLGVRVLHEHEVIEINDRAVLSSAGEFTADAIVNCAGAWAGSLVRQFSMPVTPAKGQIFSVVPERGNGIQNVVRSEEIYCVPRADGQVVIGATVEHVGYDKRVEPETIQNMHRLAAKLVPSLSHARIADAWAGLRPVTPDRLPLLGAYVNVPGCFVATGHFRNGILLAPATARVMADLIVGAAPQISIEAFSPERFL